MIHTHTHKHLSLSLYIYDIYILHTAYQVHAKGGTNRRMHLTCGHLCCPDATTFSMDKAPRVRFLIKTWAFGISQPGWITGGFFKRSTVI